MKRLLTLWAIASVVMLGLPNVLWAEVVGVLGADSGKVEGQVTDGKQTGAEEQVAHKKTLLQQAVQNSWRSRRADKQNEMGPAVAAPPARMAEANEPPGTSLNIQDRNAIDRFVNANWNRWTRGIVRKSLQDKLDNLKGGLGLFGEVHFRVGNVVVGKDGTVEAKEGNKNLILEFTPGIDGIEPIWIVVGRNSLLNAVDFRIGLLHLDGIGIDGIPQEGVYMSPSLFEWTVNRFMRTALAYLGAEKGRGAH